MARTKKRFTPETDGAQIFNVPNTVEGQDFLRMLKKFTNYKIVRWRKFARGSDRKGRWQQAGVANPSKWQCQVACPTNQAEWFAVYIYPNPKNHPNRWPQNAIGKVS